MIKTILFAICFFVPFCIGFLIKDSITKRRQQLNLVIDIVRVFETEIKYNSLPVNEILNIIKVDKRFDAFEFDEQKKPQTSNLYLKKQELSAMFEFFESIGKTDVDGQLKLCEYTKRKFHSFIDESAENDKKTAQISVNLGAFLGALIIIILI